MSYIINKLFDEVPSNWRLSTTKDVCEIITDGTHFTPTYTVEGVPFLRVTNINSNRIDLSDVKFISKEEHSELIKRCNPQKGDILLSKNGTIGLSKIVDWDWEFSIFVSLALIRTKKTILNNKFLKYYFESPILTKQIQLQSKQGTVTNLHLEEIRKFRLPVPPISEQQKIAEILSTVDDKIDVIDQQIIETQELKKGLMQRLLTKGIGHTKFKDSPLGEIPDSWEVGAFDQIATNITTKFQEKEGKCIELEHIDQRTGRLLGYDNVSDKSSVKNQFQLGDILFCKLRPYLRKFWYCEFEGGCTSELLVIRSKQGGDSRFIYYTVQQDSFINHTVSSSYGTKMPRTSWKIISEYKLPIPSLIEQQKIASSLSTVDDKLEVLQEKKIQYQDLKKGLMQQLLTGKIRVLV